MKKEKKFKTKTGYCHVLPHKIILSRDGVLGNIAEVTKGDSINRSLLIYSIFAGLFLYSAFDSYKHAQFLTALFFAIFGLYFIYGIVSSLNNSATPIIERNKIKKVDFKKSTFGLTRSRFEIFFEDEEGKNKKRLIMLPGSMNDGKNETQKALKIFTDEKLLNS